MILIGNKEERNRLNYEKILSLKRYSLWAGTFLVNAMLKGICRFNLLKRKVSINVWCFKYTKAPGKSVFKHRTCKLWSSLSNMKMLNVIESNVKETNYIYFSKILLILLVPADSKTFNFYVL